VSKYKLTVKIENTETDESQSFTGGDIFDMFERLDISELNTELHFNIDSLDDLETILSDFGFENNNIVV
jgi:hypothetical protein